MGSSSSIHTSFTTRSPEASEANGSLIACATDDIWPDRRRLEASAFSEEPCALTAEVTTDKDGFSQQGGTDKNAVIGFDQVEGVYMDAHFPVFVPGAEVAGSGEYPRVFLAFTCASMIGCFSKLAKEYEIRFEGTDSTPGEVVFDEEEDAEAALGRNARKSSVGTIKFG